jgi:putative membrane protein
VQRYRKGVGPATGLTGEGSSGVGAAGEPIFQGRFIPDRQGEAMRRWWQVGLGAGWLVAMPALAQTAAQPAAPQAQQKAAQDAPIPDEEKAFLEWLHDLNRNEIREGQTAAAKSTSQDVKRYAAMLSNDHASADQQVMAYAKQRGWTLGAPQPKNDTETRMLAAEKAWEERQRSLSGDLHDRVFLAHAVEEHDLVIARVMTAARRFPQFATTANQLLPGLKSHRDEAFRLLGQMRPQT